MVDQFRNNKGALLSLVVIAVITRVLFLDYLPAHFDEKVYYLDAARAYVTGFTDPNFEHPPLGKLLIAAGMVLFGDNAWGWRLPGVLFGSLGIVVTYLLGLKLFKSAKVAYIAGLLLSFDFLWFVLSRLAMLDIFLATFSLIGAYFLYCYWEDRKLKDLVLVGIFLGLAAAVKWSGFFLVVPLLLVIADRHRQQWWYGLRVFVLGLAISLVVYLGSYSFYLTDHSLAELGQRHEKMWNYHRHELIRNSEGATPPYLWLLNPIQVFDYSADKSRVLMVFANPLLFYPAVVLFGYGIYQNLRKVNYSVLFLTVLIGGFYFPWYFAGRYTFFFYILPALPFMTLLLAQSLVSGKTGSEVRFWGKGLIAGNLLGFLFFYPYLTELPANSLLRLILSSN